MPAQTRPPHPNRRSFLRTLMLAGAVPFVPFPALSLAAPSNPGEGFDASQTKDHTEGFEKEALYHRWLGEVFRKHGLKSRVFKDILEMIDPEFTRGLFEPRPCVRRLEYIGCWWNEEYLAHQRLEGTSPLKLGEVYESVDFNGAAYTIAVQGSHVVIGYSHFRWVG